MKQCWSFRESSQNGRRWRIQTPEFNQFTLLPDGYLLTAPNQATMRVKVLGRPKVEVRTGLHRYGGETVRLNPGIQYNGQVYARSRWVDVLCEGNLTLLITLQRPGQSPQEVTVISDEVIKVGDQVLFCLPELPNPIKYSRCCSFA
ncbi:MAG: hypothetical protein HC880_10740 [Bacteroidia bacterium]|nr:hypothetical protein [Bacteroidia bacterium]